MPRGRPAAKKTPEETRDEAELNYSDHAPEEDILNEEPNQESVNQETEVNVGPTPEDRGNYEEQRDQSSYQSDNTEHANSYSSEYNNQRQGQRDNQGYNRPTAPENNIIAIFNLNDDTTEADIRTLTEPFGEVEHVNMIYNHNTDVFRGFCFVRFSSLECARDAHRSLAGQTIKGNEIRVDFCKDKERRPMRGGYGRDRERGGGDGYYGKSKRHEYRGYDDRNDYRRDDRYERGGRRDDSYGRRERRYEDRDDRRQRYDRGSRDGGERRYDRGSRDNRDSRNDGYGSRGGRDEGRYNDRDNRPRNGYESRYGRDESRDRRY